VAAAPTPTPPSPRPLPRAIWVLGFVSLLMDVSSELIHSLLPMFLVGSLGVSVIVVGVIEGVAEATAMVTKVVSGGLSDSLRSRKPLVVIGYGLGALTKPAFALAQGAGVVVAARFVDRIGKGIRGAPRDALIADIAPSDQRGAAYGLRQSLDTVGAFLGPLLATGLMVLMAGDFRSVFWVASVPAIAAVALLAWGVREPPRPSGAVRVNPLHLDALRRLSAGYWSVVVIGAAFTLARFSEAFLVLRAEQVGLPATFVPLVLVAMNIVYSLAAYPFGRLADSLDRTGLLALGLVVLITADLVLAQAAAWPIVVAGVALWGLHLGITQGLLSAMVADAAPPELRGTAFGLFNLVSGVAMLVGSIVAGVAWERLGSSVTFLTGAVFAAMALVALLVRRARRGRVGPTR